MIHSFRSSPWSVSERRLIFEQPTPKVVEDVVARAERNEDISLHPSELKEIAIHREVLKQRADAQLKTREKLKHLAAKLKQERELYVGEQSTEVLEVNGSLEDLERALQEMAEKKPLESAQSAAPQEVADIASEGAPKEKGFTGKIKEFFKKFTDAIGGTAVVGVIVKGWISFRRQWIEWFPPKDPAAEQKKLNAIERLYGRFFGAAEVREVMEKHLVDKGTRLKIVEGKNDAWAYERLKGKYEKEHILPLLATAGSDEEKQRIREANPFEEFVSKKLDSYLVLSHVKDCLGGEKSYVTTLMGIAEGQKPKEESAVTAAAKNKGDTEDGKKEEGGIGSFFSSFYR